MISLLLNNETSVDSRQTADIQNIHSVDEIMSMSQNRSRDSVSTGGATGGMASCDESNIWTEDVESAFLEAYELFPATGRSKIRTEAGQLLGKYRQPIY